MTWWILLFALTGLATTVHGMAGFGFAQFVGPALLLMQPAVQSVATVLLLGLLINVLIIREGAPADFRLSELAAVAPGALVGVPLGVGLVLAVDKQFVQVLVGIAILGAAAMQLRRSSLPPARPGSGSVATVARLSSGALTGATGIGAAPVILWLERHVSAVEVIRYAIAAYSILLCALGVLLLGLTGGSVAARGVVVALALSPLVPLGHLLGRRLFRCVPARGYRRAVLGLVVMSGVASVVAGVV